MKKDVIISEIKDAIFEFNACKNSGIVVINKAVAPDRLIKIRLWNLIEAFTIYGLMLVILWTSMLDESLWWMWVGFGGLIFWALIVSPLVHYKPEKDIFLTEDQQKRGIWFYFFECRGLGSPRRYYYDVDGEGPQIKTHFKRIILPIVIFLDILFICALITFDAEITGLLGDIGNNIGFKIATGITLIIMLDLFLIFLAFPIMLRLDNFEGSLKFMFAFLIITIPLILCFNLVFQVLEPTLGPILENNPHMNFRGDSAFIRLITFNIFSFLGQWAGYIFWGWLQQMLFLSIFNTYFARAFDIEDKRQRLYACLLSAAFFGLIHIPNFWLSAFTCISGFFWARYFMQERNLFAMGIIHGFGGSLLNKLAPINFSVGPQEVN